MIHSFRNVASVNSLVFAATVVGLLNNVLIAAVFGLTTRVDAFFAAMILPSMFMILCIDYLGKNFLPIFAIAKKESDEAASSMTSTVVTVVVLLATAITLLLVLFGRVLFNVLLPGFDDAETALVVRYFWIMSPAIVLMAITAFHEYVCQYDEKYTKVVAIRMALPIVNFIAIITLGSSIGAYCLPVGFLAGHATVFVLMAHAARYDYKPSLRIRPHLERKVFVNSAILMSTGFISRTRSIVMNVLASTLGSGAISAMAMTMKLTEPLERCVFTGARMLMFSRTARLFAERNERDLGRLYTKGVKLSFMLLTPLLWWIGLNSAELVEVIYGRGEFTSEMTSVVAGTLIGLIPSVLFVGVNQLLLNAFYATDRVRVPVIVMPLGMLVYVGAAVPLANSGGTQGLALAATFSTVFVFLVLFVWLSRVLHDLDLMRTSLSLLGYGALSAAVMVSMSTLLAAFHWPPVVATVATLLLGGTMFFGILTLVRDRAFLDFWNHARATAVASQAVT
jgi:putative peptidoglycan lipid II flippase